MPGYNHHPDCTCGWCIGGWRNHDSLVRTPALKAREGVSWDRPPRTFDSYASPNARCPVCGAPVYFYQSPSGGRVFFDDLGPPWPKHPCTDNLQYSSWWPMSSEYPKLARTARPQWQNAGWMPFLITEASLCDDGTIHVVGTILATGEAREGYVPAGTQVAAGDPAAVRPSALPGILLLSWLPNRSSYFGAKPDEVRFVDLDYALVDFETLHRAIQGHPDAQNSVGFNVSFGWRKVDRKSPNNPPIFPAQVDWDMAVHWLKLAAMQGHRIAKNNLGVVYLNGYGAEDGVPDPIKAFGLFKEAAKSLCSASLEHLADCYQNGIGTAANPQFAKLVRSICESAKRRKAKKIITER